MMKVLVINTVPTEKNGITNVIFNYLGAASNHAIQMDVLMINDAEQNYKTQVVKYGGKPIVIKRSAKNIVSYFSKIVQVIRNNKYDAVHIHGNSHTMVLELLAAKIGGCKVRITHSHNTTCNCLVLHKLLTPLFNSLYTHGLACGKEAGIWQYGNRPFTIINNGIDTNRFVFNHDVRITIRQKLGLTDEQILIGNVGHFWGKVKNQSFIVDVFSELVKRDNNYHLVLIGDGAMRPEIEKKVDSLGLNDKVTFTGNINNVSDYLNAIDLIVMPSLFEGLPLTLVEQQANGLQCIVSDTITKEVDKTGNLCFVSLNASISEWVQSIENCNCKQGREQRSKKAVNDIAKEGYSIQTEAMQLVGFYKSVCKNSNF